MDIICFKLRLRNCSQILNRLSSVQRQQSRLYGGAYIQVCWVEICHHWWFLSDLERSPAWCECYLTVRSRYKRAESLLHIVNLVEPLIWLTRAIVQIQRVACTVPRCQDGDVRRSSPINIVAVVMDFFLACHTTSSLSVNSSDTVVHSSFPPRSRTGHEWSVGYSVSYRPDSSVWLLYEWTGHGLLWLADAAWRLRDLMFRLTQPGSVSLLLLSLKAALCTLVNGWLRVLGYMCLSEGLSHKMKTGVCVFKNFQSVVAESPAGAL